jgi:hypothetical protein
LFSVTIHGIFWVSASSGTECRHARQASPSISWQVLVAKDDVVTKLHHLPDILSLIDGWNHTYLYVAAWTTDQ